MSSSAPFLNVSEAARRLSVSVKALRLYEQRGLVAPSRSAAGWRAYGPEAMSRAAEIVGLRALGLSLAQVARVLEGDAEGLEPVLAAHQAALEGRVRQLADAVEKIRRARTGLAQGRAPAAADLARLCQPAPGLDIAIDLPWPWDGERFELRGLPRLTYLVGPLGSGKTRLARCLAEALPDAVFVGLERLADNGAAARTRMAADPALRARVETVLAWLAEEGAAESAALLALLVALEDDGPAVRVVDLVEAGLDQAAQEALGAHLRVRAGTGRHLIVMTRSSSILDLGALGGDEAILFCPPNHSLPARVAGVPGAPGYEAVATCLAPPEVRARTEGVIAWRFSATCWESERRARALFEDPGTVG